METAMRRSAFASPNAAGRPGSARPGRANTVKVFSSATGFGQPAPQQQQESMSAVSRMLVAAVSSLIRFPPLFEMARRNARETIKKRAVDIGIDYAAAMREYKSVDWPTLLQQATDPAVAQPSYYTQPFHGYLEGNLCWDAALEFDVASRSVHAPVMSTNSKELDPEGDAKMRQSFNQRTRELMQELGVSCDSVKQAVDLGCGTGVSSLAVLKAFPGSSVTGVDLSPFFIAVGRYQQGKREATKGGAKEPLTLVHANAEQTGLPAGSCDLVSMSLVCHELPQAVTRSIFKEAFRLLRPGGCLAIMELDPSAPVSRRVFSNPFAFAGFKSTEPWLEEYIALDMQGAMREAGFAKVAQTRCTPRHKTVVAMKA